MRVIGYTYDADTHCVDCTMDYARAVEYKDYVFGEYSDSDISTNGIINVATAIELEIIRDSEDNPIHPIFSTDEDEYYCGDCLELID